MPSFVCLFDKTVPLVKGLGLAHVLADDAVERLELGLAVNKVVHLQGGLIVCIHHRLCNVLVER